MNLQKVIAKRGLSQAANSVILNNKVEMKPLPYELGALEPVISGHLMDFHYGKHHRTYVSNLNRQLGEANEAMSKGDLTGYMRQLSAIKFNGGGHFNHEFFWESLAPISEGGGAIPDKDTDLRNLLEQEWGSVEGFQNYFNTRTASLQGSGWGWLLYNNKSGLLEYRQTKNQDQPCDLDQSYTPLMTMDIWEHAYYLDYKNQRPVFLTEMWKIVNWQKVAQRLQAAKQASQ